MVRLRTESNRQTSWHIFMDFVISHDSSHFATATTITTGTGWQESHANRLQTKKDQCTKRHIAAKRRTDYFVHYYGSKFQRKKFAMKKLSVFSCATLLAFLVAPMLLAGCGRSNEATVVKPEMSAEEIQKKADAKAEAASKAEAT